jgi:uncharacterized protein (DUF58 family)
MQLTLRGILVLLLPAPLIGLVTWFAEARWAALGVGLLALALFALDWRGAGRAQRFQLARRHDSKLSLGADNLVRLSLYNPDPRRVQFWVRDEPPDAFQTQAAILPGSAAPRQTWVGAYTVHPLRRGNYTFGDLNLRWAGPLGLVIRQARLPAAEPVKVYPNLLDVRRYDLLLRRNRLQEMGLRQTRMFGEGTEFERLREYLPDDDFRRIDWKATARRNRPVTVEYQTERSQNIVAVVDIGRMMQSPVEQIAKLDYVINTVLLLAYVATGKGDKVGLMTFADEVTRFSSPQAGRGQFYRMLELLYAVEPQPAEPDYRKALSYLAIKQRRRALVVIFTDLTGGMGLKALESQAALLARRSLALVVTISDPDVHQAATQRPNDSLGVYQRVAAEKLLDERQATLDSLRSHGVLTLDVPANQLSAAVINRYLELKGKTLL